MSGASSDIALDETVSASSSGADADPVDDETLPRGSPLGRYVILHRLGSGGMGIVYAAYDPELDRGIALKLLRPSAGDSAMAERRARLLREAQAMARINHPNVIAVHDVGTVDERVFVAMELVEGVTLAAWLAERERPPGEIVAAFAQAGRGLAAAHSRGLVHRDFKPDNVLFGADGRVRVLDFGLAHADAALPGSADSTFPPIDASPARSVSSIPLAIGSGRLSDPITRESSLLGTPWYMSPEQLAQRRSDARSDQWSFCASLHEALYGEHPFAHPDDRDLSVLAKRMRDGQRREIPAAKAARVSPRVKSAIERGLSTDPGARFPTMSDLVSELEPPPARPRVLGWTIAALLAAAALAVVTLRGRPGAICQGAAHDLDGTWDVGRKSAVSAAFVATGTPFSGEAFAATAKSLDEYARSWIAMQKDACEATRVRAVQSEEVLDLRTQCLAERRTELRALGDVLVKADVDVIEHAPTAARALSSLDACANVAALKAPTRLPADAAARDAVVAVRARIARARVLQQAGRYADMLSAATEATRAADATAFRPARAESRAMLGRAQDVAGDVKAAEATLIEGVLHAEASHDDAVAAAIWPAIVHVEASLYKFERADDSVGHAEAALARIGGDPAAEAELEGSRCQLERNRGHYADAAAHARAALAIAESRFGANDTRVADALGLLAAVLNTQGLYDEAIADEERALRIIEGALGPDHPRAGNILTFLSIIHEYKGDTEKALSYAQRGLAVRERALGANHPLIAPSLINLGNAEDDVGDRDAAIAAYHRALTIFERTVGPDDPQVADVLSNLADQSCRSKAYAESLAYSQRALAIREKAKGPNHTDVAVSLDLIGLALCGMGRCKEALDIHQRALGILEAGFGKEHTDVASERLDIARDELALHQYAGARAEAELAVSIFAKVQGPARDRAEASFVLARALWEGGGNRARARSLAEEARAVFVSDGKRSGSMLEEADVWLKAHPT